MPSSIRAFSNLMGLYIYYSTVIEWSASAALSSTHHTNLRQITIFGTNVTAACDASSSLPPGLLALDFPQTLGTFVAVELALDKLPPNLPEIWPRGMVLLLLADGFNDVPDVLLRLAPERINLQYNNITRLPAAIFEIPTLKWLEVDTSPLVDLPDHANPSPTLVQISFESTNVASLPEWMKRESFLRRVKVLAAKTPLCAKLRAALDSDSKNLAGRVC
ncbi:Membrane protein [Globisporangium polare]